MGSRVTLTEASLVLVGSVAFVCHVFQILTNEFWTAGLGDWGDPYFINYLLEHWCRSVRSFADPSSPPMFFPAGKTLGYSHGLILYVPFYLPIRQILHPFQAYNVTLALVMVIGIVCLYAIVRRVIGLSRVESLLVTAFFASSPNVINEPTGVWTQRLSVFLIPPILLILLSSARMPTGRSRLALAALGGFLGTLLYTQDFYTAHFAFTFALLFAAAALPQGSVRLVRERIGAFWNAEPLPSKAFLAATLLAAVWTSCLLVFGGAEVEWLGLRLRSHDWRRPALLIVACTALFVGLRRGFRLELRVEGTTRWLAAVALGGSAGMIVFLWIYWAAAREHTRFAEEYLLNALVTRAPPLWTNSWAFIRDLHAYDSRRSFELALVLGVLSWLPWFNADRSMRRYGTWLLVVSGIVFLVPVKVGGFSIWRSVFEPLPGFAVIRDPKRVIYLYELGLALAAAVVLARLPSRSAFRRCAIALGFLLMVVHPNGTVLASRRGMDVYARWVEAPIDIDPSCRSFFIKPASPEYSSRSPYASALYNIDAMFIALMRSMPTLNGFSAWVPTGWELSDPHAPGYRSGVKRWVERHGLSGVCELDIDARTMRAWDSRD